MKRVSDGADKMVFHLHPRERMLLQEVLQLYPLVPSGHQKLDRHGLDATLIEGQQLLDEALAEQRQEHRQRVRQFIEDPRTFETVTGGCHLALTKPQMEWLLQVLNDVRVGSWLKLGAPEEEVRRKTVPTEDTEPLLYAMDVCAYFQSNLIT